MWPYHKIFVKSKVFTAFFFIQWLDSPRGPRPPYCRGFAITLCLTHPPLAETSTWQHTTLTRDRRPCTRQDSNRQSLQASGRRPTHGHWDRYLLLTTVNMVGSTNLMPYFSTVSPSDPNVTLSRWSTADRHQIVSEATRLKAGVPRTGAYGRRRQYIDLSLTDERIIYNGNS
jgi:hypothetical protein